MRKWLDQCVDKPEDEVIHRLLLEAGPERAPADEG
jgi:hypothetical protein